MYYILKLNDVTIMTSDSNLVNELINDGYKLLLADSNYTYVQKYYKLVKDSSVKEILL